MAVAYLVNQYPKVSHTFIRREIAALERGGVRVDRLALRGWAETVVDPQDGSEQAATRYLLEAFLGGASTMALALALTWRTGRRADRPLPIHLVYLAEACLAARWIEAAGSTHIHAHFGTNPAQVAMLAAVLADLPWSFTVHGPEEFDRPQFIALPEKIRRSTFVVAISSFGRSQLYRLVDVDQWPKVQVVHCGLEAESFSPVETSGIRSRRLVCIGRLCEQKGQLILVEAAGRLASRGVEVELVLAGDGELRGPIEARVAELGLTDSVRITGWIGGEEVQSEIAAARAMVLPSFAEGLPVAIMEAMAAARPVVSTYVAGIPELVVPGENGWLVPAGDVDSLCDAMMDCLGATPARIQAMGRAARAKALERHSVDTEAGKLKGLFTHPGVVGSSVVPMTANGGMAGTRVLS